MVNTMGHWSHVIVLLVTCVMGSLVILTGSILKARGHIESYLLDRY